jgi:hypothetical protein
MAAMCGYVNTHYDYTCNYLCHVTVLCEWRKGTGCTVLTLCDGQLLVHARNCTLCGYVLEYYSALFVCLSQLLFVILPYIYC